MNTLKFKQEVSQAIKGVAEKYGVNVKVNKIEKANDHMESLLMITQTSGISSTKTTEVKTSTKKPITRKQQVKAFYDKGIVSATAIAKKLGTHKSYVARLITQIKLEALATTH